MVTNYKQELQAKEFLQRINIKTMKKDLQQLREADSLKEREKISKIETVKEENPLAEQSLLQGRQNLQENKQLGKIFQQNTEQEHSARIKIKEYANETEKQQIFLLESQRLNLENQIKAINQEKEPPLILEKNKILIEQKDWQRKLNPLVQEEEKNEAEQKTIEDKEKASNIPAEKQNLEKERWVLEDQRQTIEKKRWLIEGDLSKLENRMKKLDESYKQLTAQENTIKTEIIKIDNSLRAIYSNIIEREETRRKELKETSLKKIQTDSEEKNKISRLQSNRGSSIESGQRQQQIASAETKEREYLKGISLAAKEKLAQSTEIEEKQRAKFIEDVEKWAEEEKKNNQNNTNT